MSPGLDSTVMRMLPDGRRLNLRSGPIDLIVEALGPRRAVEGAYRRAAHVFPGILPDLVIDLSLLRAPSGEVQTAGSSPVASAMIHRAAEVRAADFATPMICVAGAVADFVLSEMRKEPGLTRAYVNNGGDIALWLAEGQSFDVGICVDLASGVPGPRAHIAAGNGIGGIATSGWQGRSHSLGIADAVTVLARDACTADAAATLIANAVDLPDHPAVTRTPACDLSPDSDLGARPVTSWVGPLAAEDTARACDAGRVRAGAMIGAGHAIAVFGHVQGHSFALQRHGARSLCQHTANPIQPELIEHA